jgi:hypothetical protein
LRSPWARLDGLNEMLTWASDTLAAAGRPMTGAAEQYRTWNLAALFRLPTSKGQVWLKATPRFAADEARVIAAFARVDPTLVPPVIGAGPRRLLLEHLPGADCWDASPPVITSAIQRLAAVQVALAGRLPPGLPDRRAPVIAGQISALLDGEVARELSAGEVAAARGLLSRFARLDECGLPDTIVHGDFHPGNWRSNGGPPVILDWADAHFGNPVLDGLRARDFLPAAKRPVAARAWIDAWASRVPGCDPARALSIAEPLAHLAYAVRYQEFLDGIEPSERIYHLGDPAAAIRAALRSALAEEVQQQGGPTQDWGERWPGTWNPAPASAGTWCRHRASRLALMPRKGMMGQPLDPRSAASLDHAGIRATGRCRDAVRAAMGTARHRGRPDRLRRPGPRYRRRLPRPGPAAGQEQRRRRAAARGPAPGIPFRAGRHGVHGGRAAAVTGRRARSGHRQD